MPDPISRLELAQRELDRVFGPDYARQHPELVASVVQSAASDWAAAHLASALRDVARALLDDVPTELPVNVVRSHGLVRP
jgi:hypothetical protein